VALGVLLLATVGLQLTYSEPGLLFLGPVLLLFSILVFGIYPGERLLLRIVEDCSRQARRAPRSFRARRSRRIWHPRGGALLGLALAGRAPPL
jgi:hypothetical protein